MVKNDLWIKEMAAAHGLIEPFEPSLVRAGRISFGLSSFGYDFRLAPGFLSLKPDAGISLLDPKEMREDLFTFSESDAWTISPQSFVLARSLEYFRIPRNILGLCTGKSTYARCGVMVNITPLEPEWEGHLTFPVFNSAPYPMRIYPGEGIAQVLFLEGLPPAVSYGDRKGKYQSQVRITPAKVE